jgi:NAD(P)-dependent dehydrogenase (short-subunit alcohol dehydrogenase family)
MTRLDTTADPAPLPTDLFSLTGRVALVTGASSGLGARFARCLDGAGATVIAAARREDRLEQLAAAGRRIQARACDVGEPERIRELISEIVQQHGQIDIVVNNAGTSDSDNALRQDDDEFARVLGINLVAPYLISKYAAQAMVAAKRPGSIINIASILGLRGSSVATQTGYSASKGGIEAMTRSLAAQWAKRAIRVNALAPGWFATEMTADMFANEQATQWVVGRTPLGRHGEEGELDGPLLLLASDAGSYITGQTLIVDGGWCAV